MYRIRDLQFDYRYFADGTLFKTKKEICEYLIDYHSIDCDMKEELKLLNKGKINRCLNLLMEFEWSVEKIEMDYKERCKDCACLVEDKDKDWTCDIDNKKCKEIKICNAV